MTLKKILFPFAIVLVTTLSACSSHPVAKQVDPAPARTPAQTEAAAQDGPKYGPNTIPLSQDHSYFAHHPSPNFWKLISYYVPQEPKACFAATTSMIMNALNSKGPLKSSDELVQQQPLVAKANIKRWNDAIANGVCLPLEQLASIMKEAMEIYGYTNIKMEVIHTNDLSNKTKANLHHALMDMERTPNHFMIGNFLQGVLTGDPGGMEGHISPIGAYDSSHRRVLILDVDRQWYEPYWVPESTLLKGMNTADGTGPYRGYILISASPKR